MLKYKFSFSEVESYKIAEYNTTHFAYDGHYLHRNTALTSSIEKMTFAKGDYLISTQQKGNK